MPIIASGSLQVHAQKGICVSCALEGFQLVANSSGLFIIANTVQGALYGTFDLLGRMQRWEDIGALDVLSKPENNLRIWDLWDNLDGGIERGYGGQSVVWPYALVRQ